MGTKTIAGWKQNAGSTEEKVSVEGFGWLVGWLYIQSDRDQEETCEALHLALQVTVTQS